MDEPNLIFSSRNYYSKDERSELGLIRNIKKKKSQIVYTKNEL